MCATKATFATDLIMQQCEMAIRLHLPGVSIIGSPGHPKNGLAFLCSPDLAKSIVDPLPHTLPNTDEQHWRHLRVKDIHPQRHVSVFGVYGPLPGRRPLIQAAYQRLTQLYPQDLWVCLGDFNGTRLASDACSTGPLRPLGNNHWPWLAAQCDAGHWVDSAALFHDTPSHTRIRQYPGTSRLDFIFLSPDFTTEWIMQDATNLDLLPPEGTSRGSAHIAPAVLLMPYAHLPAWTQTPRLTTTRWKDREEVRWLHLLPTQPPPAQPPTDIHAAWDIWQEWQDHMLRAALQVSPPKVPKPSAPGQRWQAVVDGLAGHQKPGKPFYARVRELLGKGGRPPIRVPYATAAAELSNFGQGGPGRPEDWRWQGPCCPFAWKDFEAAFPNQQAFDQLLKGPKRRSGGLDDLPPYLLHLMPDSWKVYLRQLTLATIQAGTLSPAHRKGRVFLIHKGGPTNVLNSWRPITVMSAVYRTMVGAVHVATRGWLDQVLPATQMGFRQGRSCDSASAWLQEAISRTRQLNNGQAWVFFLDVKRAYPSIDRRALWKSLRAAGLNDTLTTWLADLYRTTEDYMGGDAENVYPIHTSEGVRQGCNASCALFAMGLASVQQALAAAGIDHVFFADDGALVCPNEASMIRALTILEEQLDIVGLAWHPGKCQLLHWKGFFSRSNQTQLEYGSRAGQRIAFAIAKVPIRYLGYLWGTNHEAVAGQMTALMYQESAAAVALPLPQACSSRR